MLFGDAGCEHYAQKAKEDSMDIQLMINCDMISHTLHTVEESKVRINYYSGYVSIRDLAINATQQFSIITPLIGSLNQYSDSYPFYEQGFPAVYFEEDDFSPYYHTINDIISNYNMDYCREVIKSAGATLLKCMFLNSPTDIENYPTPPTLVNLYQNYPNPFNPNTTIKYSLPEASFVTLKVYNLIGEEIATLVNTEQTIGNYEVEFNAITLPSGTYFYRIQAGDFVETEKMMLIK